MNKRLFVRKKEAFQVEANALYQELYASLNLPHMQGLTLYNVYDIFHCDAHDLKLLKTKVLAEPVTDEVLEEVDLQDRCYIAYECLDGQYDQRADSAQQCLMLLNNKQDVIIKSGRLLVFEGMLNDQEKAAVEQYLINPVEMQKKDLSRLCREENVEIEGVQRIEDFMTMDEAALKALMVREGLAMSFADLCHIQRYFQQEEQRPITMSELKVLDTYWSDHCRHTTFETMISDVVIEAGSLQKQLESAYAQYVALRKQVHNEQKPMTLMDMATIGAKALRQEGKLTDLEISDEINACSIEIKVDVDGEMQDWLLMFKNETHNHPTEIEPFGGASTCIGGAIRDPLSGRSYVYQAMRITGAGDITKPLSDTLAHKLPQSKISKGAAAGYSSYGNQIGLATTYVKELYDDGYVAKRMEVGAVVGAAPKANVMRKKPEPGDVVVLLGGATGRDGVGGATGSSKEHNDTSLSKCSSEVQKGNAPMERKLQRLFRNPNAARLIKKANDFGAGGVSVAIGELADGLCIELDKVPVKYKGLSATELAISESQERMAVVLAPQDVDAFLALADEENLEAIVVAKVSETPRLIMRFQGCEVVNLSRAFLDTNGVRGKQSVRICEEQAVSHPFRNEIKQTKEAGFLKMLKLPNVASQIGLSELFDASIGKSTVLMPWGGKYQLSEQEGSVQKLPVLGYTNTCSLMSYGFDPHIAQYSPYLAAAYSVVEALARISAMGGDYRKARLSNQEYFERLGDDPNKWGKPMQAMLGLIEAQRAFGTPSIGGKDSMSGTFNHIHVPPTLITFALTTQHQDHIISTEFKQADHFIYLLKHPIHADFTPDYAACKENFAKLYQYNQAGIICAACTIKSGGLGEAIAKMSFGNRIGAMIQTSEPLYDRSIGSIVVESAVEISDPSFICLGKTTQAPTLAINDFNISIMAAQDAWSERYHALYPAYVNADQPKLTTTPLYQAKKRIAPSKRIEKPKVIIPVFPGQNCEYDTLQQFQRAGADASIYVFNNLSVAAIERSLKELSEQIAQAQILMLCGGFSAGDEPDGSGKFIANVLSNAQVNQAVQTLLHNDGLILGICNGFQALIKSGLLPYGDITKLNETSPTLFRNDINRHVSHIAYTRVTSNRSPWLSSFTPGQQHSIAMSHGEGKFVCDEATAKALFENGQVATQYVDLDGDPTMNGMYNLNGSCFAIEGITSADGRILGKMGHSERYEDGLFQNIWGDKEQNIFQNGVNYFKNK